MMTSGPGIVPTPGWFSAGSLADFTSPFASSCVISTGCMVAPMEMRRRPSRRLTGGQETSANSFETSSRPPVMLSNCAFAS